MNRFNVANGGTQVQGVSSVEGSVATKDVAPAKAVSVAEAGGADQAVLSAAGGFAAQNTDDTGVRGAKVAALQQSIAAGTYNVPTAHVADKLISALLG